MKVLNEYEGSHHYFSDFDKTDYYCMNCGKKDCVWAATSGDYYVGGDWVCTECDATWNCPGGASKTKDKNVLLQIDQLRKQICLLPTTRKGG